MNFRQKNYQRAKIKKHHQQQLDNLIGGKSEVELQQVYDLFLNYEEELKIRIGDFEKFISSKLTNNFFKELRSYNLEKKILEREKDAQGAADKMREMNISLERKKFLGKIFETEQEEFLRNRYYFANSHVKELREQLLNSSGTVDYWSTKDIEGFFFYKFREEVELENQKLSKIGVNLDFNSEKFSFGLRDEELKSIGLRRLDAKNLKLKIPYEQTYSFFIYDKIAVRDYFDEKFKKFRKRKEERNLRALAAEKTDKQRSLASSNRTAKEFKNQISIVDCCPYCGEELGEFGGTNAAHYEHIHPISKGGLSTIENTVFICADCNASKSNMTLNAFIIEFDLDRDAVFERLSSLSKDF